MKKNQKKNCGFTLTELLVVIAAITIMCGVSLVFLSAYSPYAKLKGEGNQIVTEILKTQNLSLTDQEIYKIKFNKTDNNYSIFRKIDDDHDTLIENVNLISGISFVSNDIEIRFNASGTPSTGAEITIQNRKNEQLTIQITQTGFVKII